MSVAARTRGRAGGDRYKRNNPPCVRAVGLKTREVARVLRVPVATVYRLIRGPLDAWRHGAREYRVDPVSLHAYRQTVH